MLNHLKNISLLSEKRFSLVSVIFGESTIFHLLVLISKEEEISVQSSSHYDDFEQLIKFLDKKAPLILNFSGKGIITKEVDLVGGSSQEIFFNTSPEDFYTFAVFSDSKKFISVARKEQIENQFSLFEQKGYLPVDYSIGPLVAYLAQPLIAEEELLLENCQLNFENNQLSKFSKTNGPPKHYNIGKEKMVGKEIILLASLLNHLYPSEFIEYEKGFLSQNCEEVRFKKLFKTMALGGLLFFLSILLISYGLLGFFNTKYVEYENQLYQFNDNYFQIKKMEETLKNQQFVVQNSGVLNRKFISYYVDEIGRTVPEGIVLNNLKINPLVAKIKQNENVEIKKNLIIVGGITEESILINQWVQSLKKNNWAKKIEIVNLITNKKGSDDFSLKITLE